MNSDYLKTTFSKDLQPITHVLVLEDENSRQTIILDEPNYSIGRDPRNKISLASKKVSRFHATLLRRTDTKNRTFSYWLLDGDLQGNRSTNGIFINEKRCLVQELKHEDVIRFGLEIQASYYVLNNISDLALLQSGDFHQQSPESESTIQPAKSNPHSMIPKQTLVISEPNIMESMESENTATFSRNSDGGKNSEITKLASFPELSPNPIIEMDWEGNITYLNPSAVNKFPELKTNPSTENHPLLVGLIKNIENHGNNNKLFVREVTIKDQVFEQYIHYLSEKKLIRSYVFDFTKRKVLETQLKESEQRYKAFISQTKEGIFLVDASSKKILEANNALADLLGYGLDEIYSLKLYDLIDLSTSVLDEQIEFILKSKKDKNLVKHFEYKSKNKLLVELECNITWISYGDQTILSFAVRPANKNIHQGTFIQEQGLYDLETGLPNRQLFMEQFNTAIANSRRINGLLCIIFLELEILEDTKENLGYTLKSSILDGFAKRLRASLRSGDTVAHWESSHFVCLLPQVRNIKDVGRVSYRMLESLKPPFFIDNHKIHIKTSMGIAIKDEEPLTSEMLLNQSQTALFKSKESGSNNYKFFDPKIQVEVERLLRLEKLLSHALIRNEFSLVYQPQVTIEKEQITGLEALIRWDHPDLGKVTPDQFIPLAEETGLIVSIGQWVIETACTQRNLWQQDKLKNQPICINISTQQFQQPNFVGMIKNILHKTSLNANLLELEITEKTIASDVELATKTLKELDQLGVRISLDDFGSDTVALGYLKQFHFSTLKIDRPVVKNFNADNHDKALISAMISIAKSFNLRIVAEGVEIKSEVEELSKLGCQEIQGNWLTSPLTAEDMTKFLLDFSYDL
ncbi:EAL domain-containing protein [Geminocystis sp. NIES-3709]|uniref:EAL domain-containing protein n=1 Tax=Geminocystis sp. NIES-3709 TaxID=1617448 RepID=UPI0005FCD6A4|nr:EAL domain-containing protein [Geminocystis sp. NIES-3709]BAQ65942.1 diguanylate cyclase/phosphodiesterase with PAS/PAC sensor [Geminocystis sp. NIES-3709]